MKEVKDRKPGRRYRSPLRDEGARRTRQAITAAASELFGADGYTATSLADIAVRAGVARPTVFAAFGSKAALLRQVVDEALAGDDEPLPVAERSWFAPVWEATTQDAVLDAYAEVCTQIGARSARVFETVRRAADASPDVRELWDAHLSNRRVGAHRVTLRVRSMGRLRRGLDVEKAGDILWVFNDPSLYDALVLRSGWTQTQFRTWLAAQMRQSLLPG